MVEKNYLHSTKLSIIFVPLLTLCGKGIKQSQYPRETNDSKHTLGALTSHSQATVCFSFRFMDRATLPDYREPDPLCTRSCCATYHNFQHKFNFLSLRESGRYVHLPGRSITRLAAYHIYSMWLVLSNT